MYTSAVPDLGAVIERRVVGAHGFPVIGALIQRVQIEAGIARCVASAATMEFRLGWLVVPLMEAMAASATSHACFGRFQDGRGIDAAGVVRVEMNGNADFFAQRLDQLLGRVRFAQARHVFDGQNVRAHALQFFGHPDVVFKRIFFAARIENVAGVADGGFADACRFCAPLPWGCFMFGSQLSESKMRKISMPCARGFVDEFAPPHCPDRRCSRRRSRRAAASGNRCWEWLRAAGRRRCQGSSCRKRMATSKVAPPHISRL